MMRLARAAIFAAVVAVVLANGAEDTSDRVAAMQTKVLADAPFKGHPDKKWTFMTEDKVLTRYKECDLLVDVARFVSEEKLNPHFVFTIFAAYKLQLIIRTMLPHFKQEVDGNAFIRADDRDKYFSSAVRQTLEDDSFFLSHPPSVWKAMKYDLARLGIKFSDTNLFVAKHNMLEMGREFKYQAGKYDKVYNNMNNLLQEHVLKNIKLGADIGEVAVPQDDWVSVYRSKFESNNELLVEG